MPLTCKDLRFTWQVVMNTHNNVVTTDGYRDIKSIDCRNPAVAVVHMKRVYAPYLQQLWGVNGNAPILPEHLLAKYNDDRGSFNAAPYNALPVGSGSVPGRALGARHSSDHARESAVLPRATQAQRSHF